MAIMISADTLHAVAKSTIDSIAVNVNLPESGFWDASEIVALFSAAIALVAVVVGPWSGIRIAKIQIVSASRQAWINDLRNQIVELNAISVDLAKDEFTNAHIDQRMAALRAATQAKSRLELLLNPHEKEHDMLLQLAHELLSLSSNAASPTAIGEKRSELLDQAKVVLKKEWNRVKTGT
jgi:hypothetical protein